MRHQLNQISALAEAGDLDNLKSYLAKTVSRIPNLDMSFCENRAADSVVGHYCAIAKREGVPFCAKLDLPQVLPVDEIDMCLVLSNLLENALEASLRTAPARRKIAFTACVHAERLLLIEVENAFDGEVNEKSGRLPLVQAEGKRYRYPVRHPYCRKDRRCKHLYPSERHFLCQGHALWIREYSEHILQCPCAKTAGCAGGCPLLLRKERSNTMETRANAQNRFGQRPSGPFCRMKRCAAHWSFAPAGRVFLVAAGKAAWQMAHAALQCWAVWTAGSSSQNTAMSGGSCPA